MQGVFKRLGRNIGSKSVLAVLKKVHKRRINITSVHIISDISRTPIKQINYVSIEKC